jgi:hypothetical protein
MPFPFLVLRLFPLSFLLLGGLVVLAKGRRSAQVVDYLLLREDYRDAWYPIGASGIISLVLVVSLPGRYLYLPKKCNIKLFNPYIYYKQSRTRSPLIFIMSSCNVQRIGK